MPRAIDIYGSANAVWNFGLELGRYRYLESVSVFGIFVGIFSCRFGIRYRYFEIPRYLVSVSVFLKYLLKIANFWYTHLYLAPLLRVTPSEFHSNGKLE